MVAQDQLLWVLGPQSDPPGRAGHPGKRGYWLDICLPSILFSGARASRTSFILKIYVISNY